MDFLAVIESNHFRWYLTYRARFLYSVARDLEVLCSSFGQLFDFDSARLLTTGPLGLDGAVPCLAQRTIVVAGDEIILQCAADLLVVGTADPFQVDLSFRRACGQFLFRATIVAYRKGVRGRPFIAYHLVRPAHVRLGNRSSIRAASD